MSHPLGLGLGYEPAILLFRGNKMALTPRSRSVSGLYDEILNCNEELCLKVLQQLRQFQTLQPGTSFSKPLAATARCSGTTSASDWWFSFSSSAPELRSLALKLLYQPVSSLDAESVFSNDSWIHNCRRNRLNQERVRKLVVVHES
ncbi:hypothetical protein RCL1_008212 [Eukaryota sp. TZLM3-RCL]